jgi:PTH1 family peptidyl-tRNA hydrolase
VKLVVGLGNPGPQYRDTPHNLGFRVADVLAARWRVETNWRVSWESMWVKSGPGPSAVLLLKPQTYMNLSGPAVRQAADYYQVEPCDVLAVVDDAALPLGRLRARRGGSAGGHNGLKSLIQHLGTDFPRLRIGVGRGESSDDLAGYVTGKFAPGVKADVEAAVLRAADAAEMFVSEGIERVMNAFNAASDNKQDSSLDE